MLKQIVLVSIGAGGLLLGAFHPPAEKPVKATILALAFLMGLWRLFT